MALDLQSSKYRTDVQNKPIQTQDLIPIVNDLEKVIQTGGGFVTAPFVPDNSTIIVGDDFQEVAEKTQGQIDAIIIDITNLGNNEYKITYYEEVSATAGAITKPTGSTILLDQFFGGVDAFVSTISGGKPTGDMPQTVGGVVVDVTSFDTGGNYILSGIPSAYPVALIYTIKIPATDYSNVNTEYVIEFGDIEVWKEDSTTIKPNDPSKQIVIEGNGTGVTGTLLIKRGDVVNQYIVLQESTAALGSAFLTFKSSGGNAIAMGARFNAGVPEAYIFTDPAGNSLAEIDVVTGDFIITNLGGGGTLYVTTDNTGKLSAVPLVITEANISLSDVTTNNSTAARHGFLPKLSNVNTEYLNGQGNWATPSGITNSYTTQSFSAQTSVVLTHNFGAYPVVQIIDNTGAVIIPLSITNTSTSALTVTFSVATTGTIIASVGSPQAQTFISVGANYTILTTDQIVYTATAGITITLPTAVGNTGKIFTITNGSVGNITVNTTSSQTISGNLTLLLNSYDSIDVYSNGTNYLIK